VDDSKKINNVTGPKIIIAGAGMMHGGRILHHAVRYLPDSKSRLLIVGFQVEGSLGRRLLDGEKQVQIHGQTVSVNATVQAIGAYSSHGDQHELLNYVETINPKPKKIFITHGEITQSEALSQKLKEKYSFEPIIPNLGESFEI
jgi:metallo-beta-lactamase family protein